MTPHGQNLRIVRDWSAVVGLRERDRYLIVNPFFHSFGYKAGWLAALMRGCNIVPGEGARIRMNSSPRAAASNG